MAFSWWSWRAKQPLSDAEYRNEIESLRAQVPVPGIWLFGKTGSGKSSVIHYLTGAHEATIGKGYRPETKASRRFDFPDSTEPLLSFLDTRGLGEASYEPGEDIEQFAELTQLMLVTVRVADQALEPIIDPLRKIRKSSPERPVLLVLTCLHELMGTDDLSDGPDPFAGDDSERTIPESLQTLIDQKASQFAGLHDHLIPIDLTKPSDGFADPDFGGNRLKRAILEQLPRATARHCWHLEKPTVSVSHLDNRQHIDKCLPTVHWPGQQGRSQCRGLMFRRS